MKVKIGDGFNLGPANQRDIQRGRVILNPYSNLIGSENYILIARISLYP